MTIFIKRMQNKRPAVPAQLALVHFGHYFYIRISTQDGLDLALAGTDLELVAALDPLLDTIKSWLNQERLDRLDELRTNDGGIIQPGETLPEYEPRPFARNGSGRTTDPAAPMEIRAHRYDWIKMHQLTGNPDIDIGLIGLRFPWLADTISTKAIDQARRYLAAPRPEPEPDPAPVDQLSLDLQLIQPHIAALIDAQGRPIRGAQTRIAEILQLPNTGGAYRKRIITIIESLQFSQKAA